MDNIIPDQPLNADDIQPPIPKKRGRKPKNPDGIPLDSATKESTKKIKVDVKSISQKILIAHALIAGVTKKDYLNITQGEADAIAKSVADILIRYDIEYNSDFMLWMNLSISLGIVYYPKFKLYLDEGKNDG